MFRENFMTTGSISLQNSNFGEISIINTIFLGTGVLINSTASLSYIEPTIKMYEMLGCATIL
jgi:hypothetical protein